MTSRAVAIAEAEGEPIDAFYLDLGSAYLAAGRLEEAARHLRRVRDLIAADTPFPPVDAFLSDALLPNLISGELPLTDVRRITEGSARWLR